MDILPNVQPDEFERQSYNMAQQFHPEVSTQEKRKQIHERTPTWTFPTRFTIAPEWKQPTRPSTDKWESVVCPNKAAHTTEGESSREKEPIWDTTWLKLENMLSTRIQSQKTGRMISFTGNVQNRQITEAESRGEVAEEEGTGLAAHGQGFALRPAQPRLI